jgi:intermediate peptidase
VHSSYSSNTPSSITPSPFKVAGAAHYTLRCGRALPGGGFSLPAVALVASFSGVRAGAGNTLAGALASSDLAVLLHEAGHALHSLLSRTQHQHLSGTRGPLDAVEVPSHVAERWARSAASAALATQGALPTPATPSPTPALDMLAQAVDGLVDLALHGPNPATGAEDARALVARLHPLPPPDDLLGHARFGHLVGYGGSYYAYAYADVAAADAWRALGFGANPVDPRAGAAFGAALAAGCAEDPVEWVEGRLGGRRGPAAGAGWAPDPASRLKEVGAE